MKIFRIPLVIVLVVLAGRTLHASAQAQYNLLHQFGSSRNDGVEPFGSLMLSGSTLYGMTANGGTNGYGDGVIFQISTNGTGYTILHQFGSTPSDGTGPEGDLTLSGSTLYGMTSSGGTNPFIFNGITNSAGVIGAGVIFQISTDGTGYTILHQFGSSPSDGEQPLGSLTLSGSTLYGMTYDGGTNGYGEGVIFQISTNGTGYTILHQFGSSPSDGARPTGDLTLSGSTLYGMTYDGGTNGYGYGVIFQISTNGTGYTILYQFSGYPSDGQHPYGSLLLSRTMLYGMTDFGGTNDDGVIFQISTNGAGYAFLHQFGSIPNDGADPYGSLMLSGSTLYGTTSAGGANTEGLIFQISTNGSGYTILYQFGSVPDDGWWPIGSLTLSGSTLYGMTYKGGTNEDGVIFSLGGVVPPPPALALQITSITQTGNSIAISWTTGGTGSTNELQATAGTVNGGYATNNFATVFAVTNVVGLSTNYTDVGGATNQPARYYRVASP
jgi:uncharacterized repeat protein (TIGR03803 family)